MVMSPHPMQVRHQQGHTQSVAQRPGRRGRRRQRVGFVGEFESQTSLTASAIVAGAMFVSLSFSATWWRRC
jgi:hypothetical protein